MEGGVVFESLLQNQKFGFDSSWVSNSFHGEETNAKKSVSNEEYDKCFRQPEKKRRLTVDQVHFLEKRFEEDNKLEPERKVELAKELNLQPRQVAIWFQNRRARCKTKQLEKEYEVLSSSYEKLKLEFDCLQQHNHKLKQEVQILKEKLNIKGTREKDLISNESPTNSSDQEPNPISIQTWTNSSDQEPNPDSIQTWTREPKMVICKQEYANSVSAKSDIIDSYSPDGNHSSFLEPYGSSNVFENQSDLSQEEEDNLTVLRCPKVEYESYIDTNDGSLVYPVEDQQPFWLWP